MSKQITANQLLGEMGEAAVRFRFLQIGFQFDVRSRLEAGIDGIAEVMDKGKPLARMIAVQVKATEASRYSAEDDTGFSYLLRPDDLSYWQGSNLPIIIVLYRRSDESFFWKEIITEPGREDRKLHFSKENDVLDERSRNRLAGLTVPKKGFGYYVPPLGGGEDALINMLPLKFPTEMFVSLTPYTPKQAAAILLNADEPPRFDWVIKGGTFWSFSDPRENSCRRIVDLDQVEGIETDFLASHEDHEEQNTFAYLLRRAFDYQVRADLSWSKSSEAFYFRAKAENTPRVFFYEASKKKTSTEVVNVSYSKIEKNRVDFVRHHAFHPRFERVFDQWYLVINPTYFFTTNGFKPHSYPGALLSGKKKLDNSASLRGQVIMWHRFLTQPERDTKSLFAEVSYAPRLTFGEPPIVALATSVPEDVWGSPKKTVSEAENKQESLFE